MKIQKKTLILAVGIEIVRFASMLLLFFSLTGLGLSNAVTNLALFLLASSQLIFPAGLLLLVFFPVEYGFLKKLFLPFKIASLAAALIAAAVFAAFKGTILVDSFGPTPLFWFFPLLFAEVSVLMILRAFRVPEATSAISEVTIEDRSGEVL